MDFVIENGVLKKYTGTSADVIIPDGVTEIGDSAFQDCSSLSSMVIPEGVTSIGMAAFKGCSSLSRIEIPSSVTSIGEGAFSNCTSLTSIAVPDSVTSIGIRAFYGCTSLMSIVIPDSITSIKNYTFDGCSSLKNIYYSGTAEDWSAISIGSNNTPLTYATVYYYSEELSDEQKADGNDYWCYVDGVPTVWTKETI